MEDVLAQLTLAEPCSIRAVGSTGSSRASIAKATACFHCGEPCPDGAFSQAEKTFCCLGCQAVHEILSVSGLSQFYTLEKHPGVRIRRELPRETWGYLDETSVQQRLLDFTDGQLSRITLKIPAIHCVACVWLLENLFRLHPGIGRSQVNFPRRELSVSFSARQLRLSELVALLASIGYEPELTLRELEKRAHDPARKRQWLQVGIAGFAFGNIMLLSLPSYLGLDSLSGPFFHRLFGYLSLALAAPVLFYSASDYWRSTRLALRQRILTLEVPIAVGLTALYAQGTFEILTGRGEGYLDSLAGLVFLLLCGRVFQQKTHDRIAFDRDYRCFFPLAVRRIGPCGEESVAISSLNLGDRVVLRNEELIPADSRLASGTALIDYSFVTGESEPVPKQVGDYLYAGGKQAGGRIELETLKPVSQSYLSSLWNHEAFRKERTGDLNSLTNRYSRRFTGIVLGTAISAALFWLAAGQSVRGLKAFASVLIVACPCALALAAPFALGSAQRRLARAQVFVKNVSVLERMAQVDTIVFDKTGTLTTAASTRVSFQGRPEPMSDIDELPSDATLIKHPRAGELTAEERIWVHSLARHSTHPHSQQIAAMYHPTANPAAVSSFVEKPGSGIEGLIGGHRIRLGSRGWLSPARALDGALGESAEGKGTCLEIDGQFRGVFVFHGALRTDTGRLLQQLASHYELALLSGDNEKDRARFASLFPNRARLLFHASPLDKLGFIRGLQASGRKVMMVGDGLNDAGALKQSDVGVAVVEKVGVFSPASDVILSADQVPQLFNILGFSRAATQTVRWSFGISALYNVAGISIAALGILSPLICAVLMPLSSISVVLFACGAVNRSARKLRVRPGELAGRDPQTN